MKRGVDVCSDHHLVTAFIKFKLRSAERRMTAQRHFDTKKLCDPNVKNAFVLQVKNRCQALQNLEEEAVDPGQKSTGGGRGWPLSLKRAVRSAWGSGREGRGKCG